jgi:hypothetical protein
MGGIVQGGYLFKKQSLKLHKKTKSTVLKQIAGKKKHPLPGGSGCIEANYSLE